MKELEMFYKQKPPGIKMVPICEEDILNLNNAVDRLKVYPTEEHPLLEVFTVKGIIARYNQMQDVFKESYEFEYRLHKISFCPYRSEGQQIEVDFHDLINHEGEGVRFSTIERAIEFVNKRFNIPILDPNHIYPV